MSPCSGSAAIEAILADAAPRVLGYLETQLGGRYLVGGRLTLADLAVGSNLINFRYLGLSIDAGRYPRLAAYAEGLLKEPAFRTALAAEAPFAAQMGLDRSFLAETVAA